MKRFAPILGILILVGMLALLNRNINKAGSGDGAPPPPDAAKKSTSAAATPAVNAADPLPPEITLGSLTAPTKITVGWVYDTANQPNPAALTAVIDAVKQRVNASNGALSAEIVNLDMPASELSPQAAAVTGLGVAVNGDAGATVGGKEIALAGNPGEGEVSAANVNAVLGQMLPAR